MLSSLITGVLGSISLALSIAATVFNGIFAIALANTPIPDVLRLVLFIAFALNIVCLAYLVFFIHISITKINNCAGSWSSAFRWRMLAIGVVVALVALVLTVITLIWIATLRNDLPYHIALQRSKVMYIIWFVTWGLSILAEAAIFVFIGNWTKTMQRPDSVQDLDFGIRMPPMEEVPRPTTSATHDSYSSQDPTLASPPRTPRTPTSTLRNSSSTRIGPGSSRVKLVQKGSARSSLDYPAGEAWSIDSAFDRWVSSVPVLTRDVILPVLLLHLFAHAWAKCVGRHSTAQTLADSHIASFADKSLQVTLQDTSSVHYEIRAGIHSSPPVTRSGLETIPGSRPESPAHTLDGPFLPESPSPIHAISSDAATAVDFYPSSPPRGPTSSPPNFSRPTSRDQIRPVPILLGSSVEELIHPLFRPDSPRPPPIATVGTMVTAAPNAGQPITPRTLSRMRSNLGPDAWRCMPSPSIASSAGSPPASPTANHGPGSPGPSIVEEDSLPPILPGFVLSAGQRSSFQWYSRRKSTKDRPVSSYSKNSWRSSIQL